MNMMHLFQRIMREDDGQDLIEYALIAGFISVVAYVAIQLTGTSMSTVWTSVKDAAAAAA